MESAQSFPFYSVNWSAAFPSRSVILDSSLERGVPEGVKRDHAALRRGYVTPEGLEAAS